MSKLEKFLELQDVSEMQENVFVSDRLGTFAVRPLSEPKRKEYRARSKDKKGDFDQEKFQMLTIVGQTIEPNLSNADFLSKANCRTAQEFIERKFLSGEIDSLAEGILTASGFTKDGSEKLQEDIEEAKN